MLSLSGLSRWTKIGSGSAKAPMLRLGKTIALSSVVAAIGVLGYVLVLAKVPTLIVTIGAIVATVLLGLGILSWLQWRELVREVIEPLADLAAASSGASTSGRIGDLAGQVEELQKIARSIEQLRATVGHERRRRTDEVSAEHADVTTLRQVLRLTRAMGSSLEPKKIMESITQGALTISGYERARIWLADDLAKVLTPIYASDGKEGNTDHLELVLWGDSPLVKAVTTAQIVTVRNKDGQETMLAVPMLLELTVLGVIELTIENKEKKSSGDTLDALEALASHAASTIEVSRLHEEVERRSETDALTKVLNRRRFEADIRDEIARSIRYERPLALLMIDIDHFKSINDTLGHQSGDEVLRAVADSLVKQCRGTDGAYRYGGEEFVILLRETGLDVAQDVAERIRHNIPIAIAELKLPRQVTASLGVAAVSDHLRTPQQLVGAADGALYQAKERGRNRVVVASESE